MNIYDRLNRFFEEVKTIGFWKRLFRWKAFRELSYDAYQEYKILNSELVRVSDELTHAKSKIELAENDKQHLNDSILEKEKSMTEQKTVMENLRAELLRSQEELSLLKQNEHDRKSEHDKKISALNQTIERLDDERRKELEILRDEDDQRLELLKKTWQHHEEDVKSFIKLVCSRNSIEYVESVPFKGNPDNVIRILEDYIIFDAKSPGGEDLSNFNNYIKAQTESVRKYVREDGVKKEIFLVIPSNAVEVISQFSYNLADYSVYIVTKDVLEPLILSLKKLEDYEFANELSPEEREDICRLIAKFSYINKRWLQVDQTLMAEALELLLKRDKYLPDDMAEKVTDLEKAEKITLPQDKRTKLIPTEELEERLRKIRSETDTSSINIAGSNTKSENLN